MSAQRGKDILLKIADGNGAFVTCAGLRSKRLAFNTETVDITDADSAGRWRELLAGSAVQRAAIGGSGLFKDAQSDALFRHAFFQGDIPLWQIILPGFGLLQGLFQITALEYGGAHNAEMTFEIALESAGPLQFTEVA
jgi:TP901-1 family phage major tail protein